MRTLGISLVAILFLLAPIGVGASTADAHQGCCGKTKHGGETTGHRSFLPPPPPSAPIVDAVPIRRVARTGEREVQARDLAEERSGARDLDSRVEQLESDVKAINDQMKQLFELMKLQQQLVQQQTEILEELKQKKARLIPN